MKNLKKNIHWIAGIFILCILLFKSDLRRKKDIDRYQDNISTLKDVVYTYKLKNGELASSKKALLVTNKELRKGIFVKDDSLKALLKKFKRVKAAVKIKTVVRIDTIEIPFNNPVETPFKRSFALNNPNYKLSGNVSNFGVTIDKINIPNTQRLVIGNRKVGFFKTQLEVSMTNSNPYLKVDDIESQIVTIKNNKFHVIVFAGVDYTLSPTFGLGVGYSLWSF
ncbi:DUF6549 family protein [Aquimarina macrocephali]|uniref:DUF6549 family protein n=1 Tax=Aquimarina macrocephali TaxID=666563 RepID=UPI003F67C675